MAAVLAEDAPAKINLFLHIVGKRADGYHLLDSLVVFAGLGDRLLASGDAALSLTLTGPFAAGLAGEADNLVLRAARMLAEAAGIAPTGRLVLEKNLPVASGIGGGSADAAAALRLLCRLWGIAPDAGTLSAIALRLGADVPVCLAGRAARMTGIGETLDLAPALPPFGIVLVNPGVAVSTADVFRARGGGFSSPAGLPPGWTDAAAMASDLEAAANDLEAPAIALCPEIRVALEAMAEQPDCLLTRMSGSGATCFGIYPDAETAQRRASALARAGWWSWGGEVCRSDADGSGGRI
jgi:4-diphosphocytidyl-2-C-methyl-D-erythritol kinase